MVVEILVMFMNVQIFLVLWINNMGMFKHLRAHRDRVSARQYNKLVDVVDNLVKGLAPLGYVDSDGIFIIRKPPAVPEAPKLYEVQSAGTGDGIYNCREQVFDATDWASTDGTEKHAELNTTSVEVLNLAECDNQATYVAHLAANDLLWAWQTSDDEGNIIFVGTPFRIDNADRPRIAYVKTDAGAGSTIVCFLDTDATGTEITCTCSIVNGTALNSAISRLEDGDMVFVNKIGGTWYITGMPFQTSEDCDCS